MTHPFRLTGRAAALLAFAILPALRGQQAPPPSAESKVSFLPVPDFDIDPDEGLTYGVLPVWIIKNEEGVAQRLYAPSLNYNDLAGLTGTFRLFDYPAKEAERKIISSVSQHNNRRFLFDYVDRELLGSMFLLGGRAEYSRDGFVRFFGLGPDTEESAESNYSRDELSLEVATGFQIIPRTRLELRERFRRVKLGEGLVKEVEDARRAFAGTSGIGGGQVWSHQLSLVFDGRDSVNLPSRGLYAAGAFSAARNVAFGHVDYERYALDIRYFVSWLDGRSITALRGLLEGIQGDEIPFFELPALGGDLTLRGFGEDRFIDEVRVLVSFEQRCLIAKRRVFGIDAEFEIAPFLDLGNVGSNVGNLEMNKLKPVAGVGLRALTRPDILGRLDLGFGEEGLQAFISLGYSF
ncbi:MAG: BamA/TamA family outer membrane protein [Planctomycetes bacterium]|nr:BamA/TamA family outer membrane protein [Planctomycetota bacterium]